MQQHSATEWKFTRTIPIVPAGEELNQVAAFYEEKLGFKRQWEGGGFVGLSCGDVEIMLQQFGDEQFRQNCMFRIKVENIDAYYAHLRELRVPGLGTLENKSWGSYEFHLIDPAGVCVHFFR